MTWLLNMRKRFTFDDLHFTEGLGGIMRTRIKFGPKYSLSIIKEPQKSLYEIGALINGELNELPGITDEGNSIRQGLSPEDINFLIMKMHTISTELPQEENV